MKIKEVSTTKAHIENSYIDTISNADIVVMTKLIYAMNKKHSKLWNAINNRTARILKIRTALFLGHNPR